MAAIAEVYIGSGFQNQDYPVFSLDSDCKFLDLDSGFITWLERAAKGV